MTKEKQDAEHIADSDLDDVQGGLLLPAVSAAREAARQTPIQTLTCPSDPVTAHTKKTREIVVVGSKVKD